MPTRPSTCCSAENNTLNPQSTSMCPALFRRDLQLSPVHGGGCEERQSTQGGGKRRRLVCKIAGDESDVMVHSSFGRAFRRTNRGDGTSRKGAPNGAKRVLPAGVGVAPRQSLLLEYSGWDIRRIETTCFDDPFPDYDTEPVMPYAKR